MQGRGREPTGSRQLRRKGWGSHDWGVPGASAHPPGGSPRPCTQDMAPRAPGLPPKSGCRVSDGHLRPSGPSPVRAAGHSRDLGGAGLSRRAWDLSRCPSRGPSARSAGREGPSSVGCTPPPTGQARGKRVGAPGSGQRGPADPARPRPGPLCARGAEPRSPADDVDSRDCVTR